MQAKKTPITLVNALLEGWRAPLPPVRIRDTDTDSSPIVCSQYIYIVTVTLLYIYIYNILI